MRLKFAAMGGIMLVVILLAIVLWPSLQGLFAAMGIQVLSWQRDLHRLLTLAITAFSDTPSSAAWGTLLGLSFFYGVFHAAGPGHGKAVLTTYLLSQGGARWRAVWLSCAASLLQAGVAIALVSVLVHGLGWLTREALGSVVWVERASFLMVTLLGAWLCWRALRQLRRTPSPAVPSRAATPETATHESHPHHSACGCGHEHHVDPARTGDWRTALSTVVAIGIRPCSGGVLMLGAASLLGHFWVGVAAVLTMSAGTALAVTGLALASVLARDWATRRYTSKAGAARLERVSGWAALCGGAVIMTLGISLSLAGASMPAMPLLGEPATPSPAASSHPFR